MMPNIKKGQLQTGKNNQQLTLALLGPPKQAEIRFEIEPGVPALWFGSLRCMNLSMESSVRFSMR